MKTRTYTENELAEDCDSEGRRIMMDPDIWNTCARCRGLGSELRQGETGICPECHGKGGEPTLKGQRLIAFIRKNIRLTIG